MYLSARKCLLGKRGSPTWWPQLREVKCMYRHIWKCGADVREPEEIASKTWESLCSTLLPCSS
jgi:hypothetical protein